MLLTLSALLSQSSPETPRPVAQTLPFTGLTPDPEILEFPSVPRYLGRLTIRGVAPGDTFEDVRKRLGPPTWELRGNACVLHTEQSYGDGNASLYLHGYHSVGRLEGPQFELNGERVGTPGAPLEQVLKRLRSPSFRVDDPQTRGGYLFYWPEGLGIRYSQGQFQRAWLCDMMGHPTDSIQTRYGPYEFCPTEERWGNPDDYCILER